MDSGDTFSNQLANISFKVTGKSVPESHKQSLFSFQFSKGELKFL